MREFILVLSNESNEHLDSTSNYLPASTLKTGAAVLQSKVEYDLGKLLENTLSSCSVWAAEASTANSVPLVDMRSRQLKKAVA